MKPVRAFITAAAAAAASVTAAAPASQSVRVEAGDLDLLSDKGQRILALRIQRAARSLCETEAVDRLPRNMRAKRRCIKAAQDSANASAKALIAARGPRSSRDD